MKTVLIVVLAFLTSSCWGSAESSKPEPQASAQAAAAENRVARFVVIIYDKTKSFEHLSETRQKIEEVLSALGPDDRLLILEISDSFDPSKNVKVQCIFPALPAEWLRPMEKYRDHELTQRKLHALWNQVEENNRAILAHLDKAIAAPVKGRSEVWAVLAYAAHQLAEAGGGVEKHVLIFSDLVQAAGGVRSDLPPTRVVDSFQGAQVKAVFVPWGSAESFQKRTGLWRSFFTQLSAQSFEVFDPATSKTQSLLAHSTAPRNLPNPFKVR